MGPPASAKSRLTNAAGIAWRAVRLTRCARRLPETGSSPTDAARTLADDENNWSGGGCRLGQWAYLIAGRGDHCDLPAKQFRYQLRQPLNFVLGPSIDDCDVVAFHIPIVPEPLPESAQTLP